MSATRRRPAHAPHPDHRAEPAARQALAAHSALLPPNDPAQPRRGRKSQRRTRNLPAPVVGCSAWFGHVCHPPTTRTRKTHPRSASAARQAPAARSGSAFLPAERPSSAAAGAGEPLTRAKPACPRRRLQRLVRPRLPRPSTRTLEHDHRSAPAACQSLAAHSASLCCCRRTTQLSRGGGGRADEPCETCCPRRRLQRLVRPRALLLTTRAIITLRRPRVQRSPRTLLRCAAAERPSSAAAGAETPVNPMKPACPRRRLQRLVRPSRTPPTTRTILAPRRPRVNRSPRTLLRSSACRTTQLSRGGGRDTCDARGTCVPPSSAAAPGSATSAAHRRPARAPPRPRVKRPPRVLAPRFCLPNDPAQPRRGPKSR